MKLLNAFSLAAIGILALTATAVGAEGWGTIKGQVVYEGAAPKQAKINVDKDKDACLKNGPLFDERLVVNEKNKGVRYCIVYLAGPKGGRDVFKQDIPVHPKLQSIAHKEVELDQPCCQFIPHMLVLREGQTLLVKNSAEVSHNVNIIGGALPPNINQIVPAGKSFKVEDIKARPIPMEVKCDIHPWMRGRIAVMKHPYFAVTDADGKFEIKDAPAGDFRIVIWHEEAGWVIGDSKPARDGKKITIPGNDSLDLGKIPMKKD